MEKHSDLMTSMCYVFERLRQAPDPAPTPAISIAPPTSRTLPTPSSMVL